MTVGQLTFTCLLAKLQYIRNYTIIISNQASVSKAFLSRFMNIMDALRPSKCITYRIWLITKLLLKMWMQRWGRKLKIQQWHIKSIHLLRVSTNICCVTTNLYTLVISWTWAVSFFLSESESPFYFYHCEEGTPADSLRLDSSGNITQTEEREKGLLPVARLQLSISMRGWETPP